MSKETRPDLVARLTNKPIDEMGDEDIAAVRARIIKADLEGSFAKIHALSEDVGAEFRKIISQLDAQMFPQETNPLWQAGSDEEQANKMREAMPDHRFPFAGLYFKSSQWEDKSYWETCEWACLQAPIRAEMAANTALIIKTSLEAKGWEESAALVDQFCGATIRKAELHRIKNEALPFIREKLAELKE